MSPTYRFSRRNFLELGIAAAFVGSGCSKAKNKAWRFFTAEEAKTIAALSEQIIPADQDPGATWAGVVNYIDRQLCGSLKRFRNNYRQGIAGVEESSRLRYGKGFGALDTKNQIELMHLLENGKAPGESWKRTSSSEFFALLVEHTRQGFYGDPRHGGNRDAAAWKMLGLPYPPIRGRQRYDLTKG